MGLRSTALCFALLLSAPSIRADELRTLPEEDARMKDMLGGPTLGLSACKGRPIFLYLWDTSCPYSIQNIKLVQHVYNKYKDSRLCFVPVALDAKRAKAVRPFAAKYKIKYPVYDGYYALPRSLWPDSVPLLLLVDPNGSIVERFNPAPNDYPKIKEKVDKLVEMAGGVPGEHFDPEAPGPLLKEEAYADRDFMLDVRDKLLKRRYQELDSLDEELQTAKTRTRSGAWKMRLFYEALGTPFAMTEKSWKSQVTTLQKWAKARPGSLSARVGLAYAWYHGAWIARGHGFANEVTPAGWEKFRSRLAKGQSVIDEAKLLKVRDAGFFSASMAIAHDIDAPGEYEALFKAATEFEPLYFSFYESKAIALLPQWGGRPGELEAFADQSAEATQDKEGMSLYARIMATAGRNFSGRGRDLFKQTKASWPKMKQGYFDILKRYPGSLAILNEFAWYACAANDKETATQLFTTIQSEYHPGIWGTRAYYSQWRDWALGPGTGGTASRNP